MISLSRQHFELLAFVYYLPALAEKFNLVSTAADDHERDRMSTRPCRFAPGRFAARASRAFARPHRQPTTNGSYRRSNVLLASAIIQFPSCDQRARHFPCTIIAGVHAFVRSLAVLLLFLPQVMYSLPALEDRRVNQHKSFVARIPK